MSLARRTALLQLLVTAAACGRASEGFHGSGRVRAQPTVSGTGDGAAGPACPLLCDSGEGAILELSCAPTGLADITFTGPCATGDAGSTSYDQRVYSSPWVWVTSSGPGVCNVALTFATGFTYSTDVTFTLQADEGPPGCAPCPPYVAPTQRKLTVNNPSSTCLDAGADASGFVPEGGAGG